MPCSALRRPVSVALSLGLTAILVGGCLPRFEAAHTTAATDNAQRFAEVPTPFTHVWTEPSHPFTGAAVIDTNGDGKMAVFVGGGRGQADALLSYSDGRLVDGIAGTGLSAPGPATHGAASTDIDGDGDVDLLVTREDGLTLYINDGGKFNATPIALNLAADAVPLSVAVSDMDGDGDGDIYVSVFVSFSAFKSATFNDPGHAKPNILLRNDGGLRFTDVTAQAGAAGRQNTFHTSFVNLDGDGDQDMVLSQNTGEIEILANNGDGTFTGVPTKSGYGFWMGLGIGDIDQDGDQDVFVSNIGTSIPDFLTDGDLREDQRHNTAWAMLRNDGDMAFTDIAPAMKLDGYGFAWGAQFTDLNLDGRTDLMVAQNYIKWPLHKIAPLAGKALLQLDAPEGLGFYQAPKLGLTNNHFGQSPMVVDLDGDGRADVVWLNMNGPLRAFLNRSDGAFLAVNLPDNIAALGAVVSVTTGDGTTQRQQVVASTGLMTDPTPTLHFGLGAATVVERVTITLLDGRTRIYDTPPINGVLDAALPS